MRLLTLQVGLLDRKDSLVDERPDELEELIIIPDNYWGVRVLAIDRKATVNQMTELLSWIDVKNYNHPVNVMVPAGPARKLDTTMCRSAAPTQSPLQH